MNKISSKGPGGTGNPFPPKYRKPLDELYKENGVGRSAKQRHAFWNKKQPFTNMTHIDPDDDAMRVKVFEYSWIVDLFPKDFVFC